MENHKTPPPLTNCNKWPRVNDLRGPKAFEKALFLAATAVLEHAQVRKTPWTQDNHLAILEAVYLSVTQYQREGGALIARGYCSASYLCTIALAMHHRYSMQETETPR